MHEVKAVLFDFGNVLGSFDKPKACSVLAHSATLPASHILQTIVGTGLEKQPESGQISPTAFCNMVMQYCGITSTVPDMMRIWGNIFSPNPAVIPVVEHLIDRKIRLGVLSNTNSIHWPYIMDVPVMQKLVAYGAPMVLSHEVKAIKPDSLMYATALKRLGVDAAHTLYIDDIHDYVVAAHAYGMQSEQYDCTKQEAYHLHNIFRAYQLL